jgi:hypothetical protein
MGFSDVEIYYGRSYYRAVYLSNSGEGNFLRERDNFS